MPDAHFHETETSHPLDQRSECRRAPVERAPNKSSRVRDGSVTGTKALHQSGRVPADFRQQLWLILDGRRASWRADADALSLAQSRLWLRVWRILPSADSWHRL